MPEPVTIFEVGPRDGLQNEPRPIPAADKIRLVELLMAAGLREIEVTSFVSPRWIPQLADAGAVMAGIPRPKGVRLSVLVPNMKGYEAARATHPGMVSVFTAASESFCKRNVNCTIDESFERFAPIMAAARADGIPVRGYISCVTDCPYEGAIAPQAVARVAERLMAAGVAQVSLGETIGRGTPQAVDAMLVAVLGAAPADRLAGHFHDTEGRALQNIETALAHGLRVFDSAAGGLGGCPYAPGAAGNVATEAVAARLAELGYETGLDMGALARAAEFARRLKGSAQDV